MRNSSSRAAFSSSPAPAGARPTGFPDPAFAPQCAVDAASARRALSSAAVALGAGELLVTSMDRDGTKAGFDVELTRTIADAVSVPVIASGGVGTLDHLVDGVVDGGADAVLAASIFHFREHLVAEAKAVMANAGITVRPA